MYTMLPVFLDYAFARKLKIRRGVFPKAHHHRPLSSIVFRSSMKETVPSDGASSSSKETLAKAPVNQLPPGLWVLATPLGNLGDLSDRAKQALLRADLILCEDTRVTSKLLYAVGRTNFMPLLKRCDEYVEDRSLIKFVNQIRQGRNAVLVSDAGTPCISDPGSPLINTCLSADIRVTPIPGPCAVTTLLSIAGFQQNAFVFRGFFPRRDKEQRNELKAIRESLHVARVGVWFESPRRIEKTLSIIQEESNDKVRVVVAKELTKMHEKTFRGSPSDVSAQVTGELDNEGEIGEWCLAVDFSATDAETATEHISAEELQWRRTLDCLISSNVSVSEATRQVLRVYESASKKVVYEAALKLSNKKPGTQTTSIKQDS